MIAGLAACLAAHAARAEGPEAFEEPGWMPSLTLGFDTFDYQATSTVMNLVNPPAQSGTQDKKSIEILLKIGGELMAPIIESIPGQPRLFVEGGVQLTPFASDRIFRIGNLKGDADLAVGRFNVRRAADEQRVADQGETCFQDPPPCVTNDPENFEGQGSEIDANLLNPSWYAGLGIAFQVPVAESLLLQVRPSVTYNFERVDLSGRMTTVIETDPVNERFTVDRGIAKGRSTDHSLGLGLELGVILFRSFTPIRTTLYADARFLWLVSDSTTTLTDPGVVSFVVDRDEFGIRGGAGVRFSWTGLGRD